MKIVALAFVPVVCAGAVLAAAPVQASAQDPQITKALLSAGDLSTSYGKPAKVWGNDLGRTIPEACSLPAAGSQKVLGKQDVGTAYKELDYKAGKAVWQDTVYMYASVKKAKASYDQMLTGAKARCNSEYPTDVSDVAETSIPATQVNETEVLDPVTGMPRFAVFSSTILDGREPASNGFENQWSYTVFLRDGTLIHQISVIQNVPLRAVQAKDARQAVVTTADRFSRLP